MENMNERIAHLRKLYRMTQLDLARKLNVSESTVSKWERGESTVGVDDAVAVAEFFKVSLDYIIYGKPSPQDKEVLNRRPAEAELLRDAKEEWITSCNKLIRENNLSRYKDIIFPSEECKKYLEISPAKEYKYWKERKCAIGIFVHDQCKEEYREYKGTPFSTYIALDKVLAEDNYELFVKTVALKLPFCDRTEPDYKPKIRSFDRCDEVLGEKDIHGLTEPRFYSYLVNQQDLMRNALFLRGGTEKDFLRNKDELQSCCKKELTKALNGLEKANPNFWEITKLLIEGGAYIQKAVGLINVSCPGDYCSSYELKFGDDIYTTELVYGLAKEKLKKINSGKLL